MAHTTTTGTEVTFADFPLGTRVSGTVQGQDFTGTVSSLYGHGGHYKITDEGEWLTLVHSTLDGLSVVTDGDLITPAGRTVRAARVTPSSVRKI
jgi:hypothetical protein